MIYNTIHHDIRNRAGLSLLEYCILESIYKLSKSDKAKYTGWCNASRAHFIYLASEATIKRTLLKLSKGDNAWIEYKDSKRLLKRTTSRYYNEVMCYIDGTANFTTGQNDPYSRVKTTHVTGQNDPDSRVKTTPNNNRYNNIDNNKDKGVSVSVPKTKEQLRTKQFEENIKQVEFPKSVENKPKLKEWVIHYMKKTNEHSPLKYYSPNHLKKTTKQVYNILVEQKKTPKYLVKLIKESVSREWRTLNSEWVKDDTVNKTLPNFSKYSAH